MNKVNFYASGLGDSLVDSQHYPPQIQSYLMGEQDFLSRCENEFECLVEVGCMEGRYLDWSVKHGKKYLGVDIVSRYIRTGRKRISRMNLPKAHFQMMVASSEQIHELFSKESLLNECLKSMLIFPFNSFGNMRDPYDVLKSLAKVDHPFIIFSYDTTNEASEARLSYYRNCGYKDIQRIDSDEGIRFVSEEGLDTIAYHTAFLRNISGQCGIQLDVVSFSEIGIVYKRKF